MNEYEWKWMKMNEYEWNEFEWIWMNLNEL